MNRLALPCVLLTGLLAACGTLETYPVAEHPDAEVAVLEGYGRYYLLYWAEGYISAVDGVRPKLPALWARSVKLLPGKHWIEVYRDATVTGESVCAFEADFLAGHRYRLLASSAHADAPYFAQPEGEPHKGTLWMEVSAPGSPARTLSIAADCAPRGSTPQLCRQDADCEDLPDHHCQPMTESSFGICRSRNR